MEFDLSFLGTGKRRRRISLLVKKYVEFKVHSGIVEHLHSLQQIQKYLFVSEL